MPPGPKSLNTIVSARAAKAKTAPLRARKTCFMPPVIKFGGENKAKYDSHGEPSPLIGFVTAQVRKIRPLTRSVRSQVNRATPIIS